MHMQSLVMAVGVTSRTTDGACVQHSYLDLEPCFLPEPESFA